MWGYTININGNVRNVFGMQSFLFRIFCTFLLKTINISLSVLVCGMCVFYFRDSFFHNLFYHTDVRLVAGSKGGGGIDGRLAAGKHWGEGRFQGRNLGGAVYRQGADR